jgi:hypothetical protein
MAAGERYAVEVTRVGQRLILGGQNKARSERDVPLLKFGNELEVATEGLRERSYLLILCGLPEGESWHRWKRIVTNSVVEFVRSRELGSISFPGGVLSAFDDGEPWIVTVTPPEDAGIPGGHPSFDIAASINEMLRHALEDKAPVLASETDYDQRMLLLLNTYFFGDDIVEIRRSLARLIHENAVFSIYDSIFYVTGRELHEVYRKQQQ